MLSKRIALCIAAPRNISTLLFVKGTPHAYNMKNVNKKNCALQKKVRK